MSHEKVAVLLLLVFTAISTNPVIGTNCSERQKARIMKLCEPYIRKGNLVQLPTRNGPCCLKVRSLQKKDAQMMQCVAGLLNSEDIQKYDATKVKYLSVSCKYRKAML
uniref:Bifunctional inhibitor/plant lipid transfer protein/seed storage helical domain-containing protein n=1 Tax=Setaria viridis TaxID=4556 RepID=A0A4U6TCW9_SETVI|nr:hypothetical protein SEVIR_8G076600v2 [Setaria viridis]